jgi:hypothetical protein
MACVLLCNDVWYGALWVRHHGVHYGANPRKRRGKRQRGRRNAHRNARIMVRYDANACHNAPITTGTRRDHNA